MILPNESSEWQCRLWIISRQNETRAGAVRSPQPSRHFGARRNKPPQSATSSTVTERLLVVIIRRMRREPSPKVVEHLKASGPSAWMCAPASGACTPEQIELGNAFSLLMHAEIESYLEGLAEWLLDRATTVWRSNERVSRPSSAGAISAEHSTIGSSH